MTPSNTPVLITGASQGIGFETAKLLCAQGFPVVMVSRSLERITAAAKACSGPHSPLALEMDVTSQDSVDQAADTIRTTLGPISVLINNAGIGADGGLEDLSLDIYRQAMETNYFGVIRVTKTFLADLKTQGGILINVSSVVGYRALPKMSAYACTKFALVGLSESLRAELKPLGIRVVDVAPGRTDTNFKANLLTEPYERPAVPGMEKSGEPAANVARAILGAIHKPRARVLLTRAGKAAGLVQRISPALLDRVVDLIYQRQQAHNGQP